MKRIEPGEAFSQAFLDLRRFCDPELSTAEPPPKPLAVAGYFVGSEGLFL